MLIMFEQHARENSMLVGSLSGGLRINNDKTKIMKVKIDI